MGQIKDESSSTIIRVKNLCKSFRSLKRKKGFLGSIQNMFSTDYEEIKAVDKVSFDIKRGEIVGYLGPNGAGKSTTIKMLTGILHPTSGDLLIDGIMPQKERIKNCKKIGVVFGQRTQLMWDIPAADSFELMGKMYAIPRRRFEDNLSFFTELLGMKDFIQRPVRMLSLGQRMRCELVASLLHDPYILYLDEPTIGLDVVAKEKIREFIIQLNHKHGTTIILTTHDIADIERLCRRVIIIDKGLKIYDGSLDTIKQDYCRLRRVIFSLTDGAKPEGIDEDLKKFDGSIIINTLSNGSISVGFDPRKFGITELTRHIVNNYSVKDLSAEDADLEVIIRGIYQEGTGR